MMPGLNALRMMAFISLTHASLLAGFIRLRCVLSLPRFQAVQRFELAFMV